MPLSQYRKYFPVTLQKTYLNHAAVSPLSTRVTDKLDEYIDQRSFGSIETYQSAVEVREQARKSVARLINAQEEQIAFITNTSEGFNHLVNGLQWQKGDQIILTDYEFPANVYPFLNMERFGVEIIYVPNRNGTIQLEDIESRITPRTRLLSISFVEFSNGFRNDLESIGKICRQNNIIFSVDGIQGVGAIPMDVQKFQIDFMSNGGHKWLMGPMGAGFMYIRPQLFERLYPAYTGWLAVQDSWEFTDYKLNFLPDARRYEYAVANFMGITGLSAAVDLLLEAGTARIERHLLSLGKVLVESLREFGLNFQGDSSTKSWSGIYSFSGKRTDELYEYLLKKNIICSLRNKMLRVAPHFYNTMEEIEQLTNEIKKFYF